MQLGVHFYVLSIDTEIRFFEGFRDILIEIKEKGFPIQLPDNHKRRYPTEKMINADNMKSFLKKADENLHLFYQQEPLKVVIIGIKEYVKLFHVISKHKDHIITTITGKFNTDFQNLGKVVWYMMRLKLARTGEKALRELTQAKKAKRCASGIHNIWQSINQGKATLLIVENEYSLHGRINPIDQSLVLNEEAEITTAMDDIVDIIVNRVMENGGRVVFIENGLLKEHDRIALIMQESDESKG